MITSDDVLDSGRRFGVNIIHQCNNGKEVLRHDYSTTDCLLNITVPVVGAVLYVSGVNFLFRTT